MKNRLTERNQSVEKTLQIIETMAENRGPMRLSDISSKVRYPASTVLRMLNALISLGYVKQDADTSKYLLTMKFCRIGELIKSQYSIRDIVRPYLEELARRCQESSCLAIEDDMTVVYIDVVDGPDKILRTLQRIGKMAPMHCTGVGKLLLLNYSEEQLKSLVERKGLPKLTENTITTLHDLGEELKKIRMQGYALDNEECEIGARCVAAPIRDYTGRIVACMSISGPATRITMEKIENVKDIIIEVSNLASLELGFLG